MHSILNVAIVALCVHTTGAEAQVRVIDGDTLEIDGQGFRLNGIDAPEVGQTCNAPAGQWHCGKEAANFVISLVSGHFVECDVITEDQYGRLVATCFADGNDIGELLVAEGLAWAFVRYTDVYIPTEEIAKSSSVGIWMSENQPAWEFRAQRWQSAIDTSPRENCPIKGNISPNGHIYHTPWSPWYDRTVVSLEKGEQWFCDELEALQAGWRAPYWP